MLSQETKRMIYGLPLLLLLGAVPARAGSIAVFSNLGPGQSFNTQQGWEIDAGITGDQVIANAFTPAADVDLTQAQLALGSTLGLDTMDLYLESDSSGAPGAVLAELTLQGSIGAFTPPDGGGALVTYTCTSCPTLAAGTQYWLVASEPDSSTVMEWNWNSVGDVGAISNANVGNFAYNNSGSINPAWTLDSGDQRGAFVVEGTLNTGVPEPGTWLLLGSGLAGMMLLWQRRSHV